MYEYRSGAGWDKGKDGARVKVSNFQAAPGSPENLPCK
jgi:hypothetical protein